jgi:DNA-binding NtrC family response regulator
MQSNSKKQSDRQAVILFADDDEACLDVGVKMLQKLGYTILTARDGKEALDVFVKNQNIVDLVILDMKMPHNGGTTFEQIIKIDTDAKILIASVYTEDRLIREMQKRGCCGFIQKPFSLSMLAQQVSNALRN